MLTSYLLAILTRDLRALGREIRAYPDDDALWVTRPGVTNPGGTLALHLMGNLKHYVGAKLGGVGYRRDRPAEFSTRGVSREDLVRQVEETIGILEQSLPGVSAQALSADFPEPVGGHRIRTDEFLLHLSVHFAYHLGQMDYHRRLVTGQAGEIGALALRDLSSARAES